MKVEILTNNRYQEYDLFISEFEEALLYHTTKYKDLLEKILCVDSCYLMVVDTGGLIEAVLPLMKKKGKFGIVVNSLPYYGSNGGILSKSNEAEALILSYYEKIVSESSVGVYINSPLTGSNVIPIYDAIDYRVGQWTFIKNYDNFKDNIILSYHKKTRNLVRKAIKLGVEVRVDNSKMNFLYKTHLDNMQNIGGKAKSKKFFDSIDEFFVKGVDYNIYVAFIGGKPIGAILLFYYNKIVEYFTPVVISDYRSYQSTSLIIYQSMIDASKNGFKWWNWGGTWESQNGVYHFKNRFGAIDKKYNYFIKINNAKIYNSSKDDLLREYGDFYTIPFSMLGAD